MDGGYCTHGDSADGGYCTHGRRLHDETIEHLHIGYTVATSQ